MRAPTILALKKDCLPCRKLVQQRYRTGLIVLGVCLAIVEQGLPLRRYVCPHGTQSPTCLQRARSFSTRQQSGQTRHIEYRTSRLLHVARRSPGAHTVSVCWTLAGQPEVASTIAHHRRPRPVRESLHLRPCRSLPQVMPYSQIWTASITRLMIPRPPILYTDLARIGESEVVAFRTHLARYGGCV